MRRSSTYIYNKFIIKWCRLEHIWMLYNVTERLLTCRTSHIMFQNTSQDQCTFTLKSLSVKKMKWDRAVQPVLKDLLKCHTSILCHKCFLYRRTHSILIYLQICFVKDDLQYYDLIVINIVCGKEASCIPEAIQGHHW